MNAPAALDTPPLLAIAGPTAVGKSALALAVCAELAQRGEGGEIVTVDSAQVYRGMDIGTAKPDAVARAATPHHLLDIADPAQAFSAARFAQDARVVIAGIRARGRVPVLVGGTLLYFRALFEGLSELPAADPGLRAQLAEEAVALGWPALHARLAQMDPVRAASLHPNDGQRIQRALEILQLGVAPSSSPSPQAVIPGTILRIALRPPERAVLDTRIVARFAQMLAAGLVDEVAQLRARGDLHLGLPSMRAVGYRQLWGHLDGEYALEEAVRLAIIATRQYAKRQMTWLRGENERWPEKWIWIEPTEPNAAALVLSMLIKGR